MKTKQKTMLSYLLNTLLALGVYLVLSWITGSGLVSAYYAKLLIPVGFYIILAVSLNIPCGCLGQLPLGHAGFMAVGAYTSAIFTKLALIPNDQLSFGVALLLGGVLAALIGIVVGLPALRLHGDYLAILTLGFGEIIRVVILNLPITGGAKGLKSIPTYTNFSWVYVWVIITLFLANTLMHSRHGRAEMCIRDSLRIDIPSIVLRPVCPNIFVGEFPGRHFANFVHTSGKSPGNHPGVALCEYTYGFPLFQISLP